VLSKLSKMVSQSLFQDVLVSDDFQFGPKRKRSCLHALFALF